jgi:allantoinase
VKPSERSVYSAIVDRPALRFPDRVRLVIWPIVNVEVWEIERLMPRQALPPPTGASIIPDVPNWSWHEYGMRVGFWRLKAVLDRLAIRPTLSINAAVCDVYPRLAEAAVAGGWELMGHGYVQMAMPAIDDEREAIHRALDTLQRFSGKRPVGWLGPGLAETLATPDLLAEAGVEYIGDWVHDDEPTEIQTRHGPLVTLPYAIELNDITVMLVERRAADGLFKRATDAFETLYAEASERAKIMAVAVHPYLSGVPHRIKYFEALFEQLGRHPGVVFWTGAEILDWYRTARR